MKKITNCTNVETSTYQRLGSKVKNAQQNARLCLDTHAIDDRLLNTEQVNTIGQQCSEKTGTETGLRQTNKQTNKGT